MLDMETKLKLAIQEALSKIGANVEITGLIASESAYSAR